MSDTDWLTASIMSSRITLKELEAIWEAMPAAYQSGGMPVRKDDLKAEIARNRRAYWDSPNRWLPKGRGGRGPKAANSLCKISASEIDEWLRSLPPDHTHLTEPDQEEATND